MPYLPVFALSLCYSAHNYLLNFCQMLGQSLLRWEDWLSGPWIELSCLPHPQYFERKRGLSRDHGCWSLWSKCLLFCSVNTHAVRSISTWSRNGSMTEMVVPIFEIGQSLLEVEGCVWAPCRGLRYQSQRMKRVDRDRRGSFFFFLRGRGLAFVLSPPPLKRSPNRQIRRGPASRRPIGCGGEADAGAAAGGSEDSSSSLSRRGTITQHQPFSHTTCRGWGPGGPRHAALAWVTPKRRRRTRLPSASWHHRWA